MKLIFFIFTVVLMTSSIEMAPSEELEKELTLLKFKLEYLEKNDKDLKKKIEGMEKSNNELKEILGVFMDSLAVSYADDDFQTRFFQKFSSILWKAALDRPPFSLEAVRQVQDGKMFAHGIDNDCCKNLTNEINDVKSNISDFNVRLGHFNDRLNDNTGNIVKNELAITTNKKQTDTNTDNIDSNANKIDTNTDNIDINANKIDSNIHDIATNRDTIDTLTETTSHFVSYCGYDKDVGKVVGIFTYERLLTNINTFPTGGLDIKTGVFTPPTQGTYLVNANLYITGPDERKTVYVNLNGKDLDYGRMETWGKADRAGTAFTIQMSPSDTLYLITHGNLWFEDISFCITLIK